MPETLARLAPAFHERVWGVADLAPWFPHARAPQGKVFGEAWFSADPPVPILVKFLFTSAKLSVQVHPGGGRGVGKTEMWRILRAGPGASIALGFERPVEPEELRAAALDGSIERLLRWIPVRSGETYFIPAGTIHAIGAGLTICEIQQNSDITYRLYDYGRPRELHLDQSLAATNFAAWRHPGASVPAGLPGGWQRLVACPHFVTDSLELSAPLRYQPDPSRCELLICVEGAARLDAGPFLAGEVCLIPAGSPALAIEPAAPGARLLRTYAPGDVL